VELLDFMIEDVEGGTERAWQAIVTGEQRRPGGAKDAQVEFGVEEGNLQPFLGLF